MNAAGAPGTTLTPSGMTLFGSAISARSIALSTTGVAPRMSGVTRIRVERSWSSSGVSNPCWTADTAASGVSPPTGTPPIVTPSGIAAGGSAAPRADASTPATARPARMERRSETRFTP